MGFPDLDLPIPLPSAPMEAKRTESIPEGDQWIYEPKWDGFRALVFRSDGEIVIQSKNQKPLTRYFPELVEAFSRVRRRGYVLDGEITIAVDGVLSFDDLLLRIHPAESRVRALAEATPAAFIAFDLLCTGHSSRSDLSSKPFEVRRQRLETYFQSASSDRIFVTPSTNDRDIASRWFRDLAEEGLDGVMAKRRELDYRFGERDGMLKVKHFRTADCVIGGYRQSGDRISLVLGLFDQDGNLRHVGHTGSLPQALAPDVLELLEGFHADSPFDVGEPGGPSRWSSGRAGKWQPVRPRLVAEVRYDHFSQGRFRHGAKFLRWRPDKDPEQCGLDQVATAAPLSRLLEGLSYG